MLRRTLGFLRSPLSSQRRSRLYLCLSRGWPRLWGTLGYLVLKRWFDVQDAGLPEVFGVPQVAKVPGSQIILGRRVILVSSSSRATAATLYAPVRLRTLSSTAAIIIGDGVGLNGTSITARSRTIRVGDDTMFAPNVTVIDSDYHAEWPPEGRATSPDLDKDADVIVGRNVWVGMQSILLKGTTIGDGAIIAAGSVVTGHIPPNVLAGGVPARVIRPLG